MESVEDFLESLLTKIKKSLLSSVTKSELTIIIFNFLYLFLKIVKKICCGLLLCVLKWSQVGFQDQIQNIYFIWYKLKLFKLWPN